MTAGISIVLTLIAAICSFKAWAVVLHIKWIFFNGQQYLAELDALKSQVAANASFAPSEDDLWAAITAAHGDKVAVMGFKEHRAHAKARSLRVAGRNTTARLLRLLAKFYDFTVLGFVAGASLVIAGVAEGASPSMLVIAAGAWLAVALQAIVLLNCAEATVNYAVLSSYGLAHHSPLRYIRGSRKDDFLFEVLVLVGLVTAALFVDTVVMSFLSTSQTVSFDLNDIEGLSGLFNCFYSSFMTFIFSTPIAAEDIVAKCFVIVVSVQGAMVLILALTAFANATPIKD